MNDDGKQLSNPFSTGGGGPGFENQVQTAFVVLMLAGGAVPCLPAWPIQKIKLQGRYAGYNTDDFIAFVEDRSSGRKAKLLAQIKHGVSITENDPTFSEVVKAAWSDFQSHEIFDPESDVVALISGPLSAHDVENARTVLEWARHSETAEEFFNKVNLAKFSSKDKQNKLQAFRAQLNKANNGKDLSEDELWRFLKSFHILGYDLDVKSGVALSLLLSLIAQFTHNNAFDLWAVVSKEVSSFNQNAGTLTPETISQEIRIAFSQRLRQATMPTELATPPEAGSQVSGHDHFKGGDADALMFASLLGAWDEKAEGDRDAIRELIEGDD
jgi:hypothetical protein